MEVTGFFQRGILQKIVADHSLFPMMKVSQTLKLDYIDSEDLPNQMKIVLENVKDRVKPGMRIGITAGSRGIDRIDKVLALVIQAVREKQGIPFIVPCMGSHGVDAAGQKKVLAELGITEQTMKAPIVSEDQVVEIDPAPNGCVAYIDRNLLECDGVIVVNRVKAHTAFHGPVESGLCKMMAVGMGKQKGAASCHRHGFRGMSETVIRTATTILSTGKILFGLALLENSYGKLCYMEAVPAEMILKREEQLLMQAKAYMPSLPFKEIDILIVDEMGKDISGSGMDTNVIGRYPTPGMTGGPMIQQLVVLSLTEASEGSGHGMGFADFISARLMDSLDLEKTYTNGLTNRTCGPAKMPPVMPDDKTAIQAAIRCCMVSDMSRIRAVRIKNTHELQEFYVSPAMIHLAEKKLVQLEEPCPLKFDEHGMLCAMS